MRLWGIVIWLVGMTIGLYLMAPMLGLALRGYTEMLAALSQLL